MPSVADVLVDGLVRAGAPRLFGVPGGGSNLELLDAARRRGLPFVLTHTETAACIMAAVTGDLTGAPGAAMTTLGPGTTSAVNGVAHAFLDRSPLVLFTDRHPDAALAYTTHQRIDHAALLGPVTKASFLVAPDSAARAIADATRLALAEPRGPVHLDLPADVAARAVDSAPALERTERVGAPEGRSEPPEGRSEAPDARALDQAGRLLAAANRPLLVAGLGARSEETAKWLRALAESLPAPVLVTYKAKGVMPDPHPLVLGLLTGGALEEPVLARADLIVAIGLDTVELIPRSWPASAPVLHLAASAHGGGYYRPRHEVVGDVAAIIEELAPRLRGRARADWTMTELDGFKRRAAAALAVATPGLAPHRVVQIARELTPAGTIAAVDAGAHMFPATAFWQAVAPHELLISNGLSTMGFALPAAIAAQLARPDRRVLCLTGDGGLMMVAAELETAVRLGLPIVVVVFDDRALSLIRVKQEQRGVDGDPLTYAGPDLVALARSFGCAAFTATTEEELARALEAALAAGGPALVDARIDPSGYRRMLEIARGV